MENKNQIEILASTSLESQSYEQAYKYYSQLLETDLTNKTYWIGKAISAGYLSSLSQMKINETVVYIKSMLKTITLTDIEKQDLAKELIKIAEVKINEGLKFIDQEIEKEFNSLQIPAGTLYEVHKTRKLSVKLQVGGRYRSSLADIFDLVELACELHPIKSNYEKVHKLMNVIFSHTKDNLNYFGVLNDGTEHNIRISKIWNTATRKIKELDPTAATVESVSKPSSGCFIATATTGDYNHPTVMQLRLFRDNTLENYNWGREFIQFYYRNSPPIADYISQKKLLKKIIYFSFIKPISVFTKLIVKM